MVAITDPAQPTRRIAVVVVNYRTPDLALACIDALAAEREALPDLSVVLVDGGSADGSAERLGEGLARVDGAGDWVDLLALPINGGFGYANNQAILRLAERAMPPEHVCLINPDARIRPGALSRLADTLDAHPRAGAVGALLEDEDGTPLGSAFTFPSAAGELGRGAKTGFIDRLLRLAEPVITSPAAIAVPWVTGAAVMLRMAALREAGLFDDGFFLYFEEVELMHRLRAHGWAIWHQPAAHVIHAGGGVTDIKWGADGFHKRQPLPRYWYESRRRCLVRTSGAKKTLLSGAAFIAGRSLWQMRAWVQRRPDPFPLHTTRDTVRYSLWPSPLDRRDHIVRFGDRPGALPGWMHPDADGRRR